MNIFLSEMQEKQIISVTTGVNLGHIVDVEIDNNGNIIGFIAENRKLLRKPFKTEELTFKYKDITKIGKDVILVNI